MEFWEKNKNLIILITSLFVLLGFSYYLSTKYMIFGFSSLIIVLLLGGLGFSKVFQEVFPFEDTIGYLTNALILGILLNTLILLFLGLLGITYSDVFFLVFGGVTILLNIVYAFLSNDSESEKFIILKAKRIDVIWLFLFILLFFFIVSICLTNFHPNWDSFNFWAVDAKYLYENRILRDTDFDILRNMGYSSYYPFLFFLSYIFFGGVYEQFASLMTVLFAFLSFLILFNHIRDIKSVVTSSFSYLAFFVVVFSFLSLQSILVSLYADVLCAFLILLYSFVLLKTKKEGKSYFKRFFLISTISLIIYLVKAPYWPISFFLIFVWIAFDRRFIRENITGLLKDKSFIFTILLQLLLLYSFWRYLAQFESSNVIETVTSRGIGIFSSYVLYIFEVIKLVSEKLPLIMLLYGSFFLFFFQEVFRSREKLYASILFLLMLFIPIVFYTLRMKDLKSLSLLRYISLGFFLLPYTFSLIKINKKKMFEDIFLTTISILGASGMLLFIIYGRGLDFRINVHSGKYQEYQVGSYQIVDSVISQISSDEKVMVVDKVSNGIGNMAIPGIYVRYYLFENSVGGQYQTSLGDFHTIVNEFEPDYLLVLGYDGYWKSCEEILLENKTYLIPRQSFFEFSDSCPVQGEFIEINP